MQADRIYSYPILDLNKDDPNEKQLHKTFKALRELYNSNNEIDKDLPYGKLDGWGFGLTKLKVLLYCASRKGACDYSFEEVDRMFLEACTSADPASKLTEFVHWATDICMDFIYQNPKVDPERVALGVEIMQSVMTDLKKKTIEIFKIVLDDKKMNEVVQEMRLMLQMLHQFFDYISVHHRRNPTSRVGVDEILTVGKETDFARRGVEPTENVHRLFDELVRHHMSMFQCLESIAQVIERQLEEQEHLMPIAFALNTIARVMPKLDLAVQQSMPLETWSEWLETLKLHRIDGKFVTEISENLASASLTRSTTRPASTPTVNKAALNSQQTNSSNTAPSTGAHLMKALQNAFDQEPGTVSSVNTSNTAPSTGDHLVNALQNHFDQEPGTACSFNSLFDGDVQQSSTTSTPRPSSTSASLPTPQGRSGTETATTHQSSNQPQSASATPTPTPHGPFSSRRRPSERLSSDLAARRRPCDLSYSRTLAEVASPVPMTPSIADNGSEFSNQSTPATRHATGADTIYLPAYNGLKGGVWDVISQWGTTEAGRKLSKRLTDARARADARKGLLRGEVLRRESAPDRLYGGSSAAVDRDGDSPMAGGVLSEESEISEED